MASTAKAVVAARQELLAYDCDGLTLSRHQPPLVVLPETTAQVAAAVKLCHQQGVPFVARGSGTGLSGGAVAELESVPVALGDHARLRQGEACAAAFALAFAALLADPADHG